MPKHFLVLLLSLFLAGCGGDDNDSNPVQGTEKSESPQGPTSKKSAQVMGPATCSNPAALEISGLEKIDLISLMNGSEAGLVNELLTKKVTLYVLQSKVGQDSAFHAELTLNAEGVKVDILCRELADAEEIDSGNLATPYTIALEHFSTSKEILLKLAVKKIALEKDVRFSDSQSPEEREEIEKKRNKDLRKRGIVPEVFSYRLADGSFETRYFQQEKLKDGSTRQVSLAYKMISRKNADLDLPPEQPNSAEQ